MKWIGAHPPHWPALAHACKERAGWQCEQCDIAHRTTRPSRRTGLLYPVYLVAAHLDHDIWNPSPRLQALCPSCHGSYDSSRQERQRWLALEIHQHHWLLQRWQEHQRRRRCQHGR